MREKRQRQSQKSQDGPENYKNPYLNVNGPSIVHNQFPYVSGGGGGYPSYNPPTFTQSYSSTTQQLIRNP